MAAVAKKILGTKPSKPVDSGEDDAPQSSGRVPFQLQTAIDADGKPIAGRDAGKLQAVPANWNADEYRPLKRAMFADEAVWTRFQADIVRQKATALVKEAEELEKRADMLGKITDVETRKRVNKAVKARKMLEKLEKELANIGLSDSDIANFG